MTDFEKWWKQQVDWGFKPELFNYMGDDEVINIRTEAQSSNNFRGYSEFKLEAEFDLEGKFLEAGVWE